MGKRNRRAEPTTNKVKRRLSLTLSGRIPVSPRRVRTRWSIPTVLRRQQPAQSPLRARKAESQKTKKQLRSTTVSTPRLLMAAIKSITSVPILGITCPPHSQLTSHQLLVLPFFRIIILLPSPPSLTLLIILSPVSCPRSGLPVLVSTSGTISLFHERSAPPRCIVHTSYTLPYLRVCGCIIGTSAPPSRLFTASDYYSLKISKLASFFCHA